MKEPMSVGRADLVTGLLAGALAVAYTVFAHYASATPGIGPWTILLAAAPMAVVGFSLGRQSGRGVFLWLVAMAAIAAAVVLAWAWPTLHNPIGWLYFVQHVSFNGVLAMIFGRSLLGQREPLVTVFAYLIHEAMTPELLRYTRQVTLAWTLFFLVSTVLSILLFVLAPIAGWSTFANLFGLPSVAAMFIVENEVRKRVLPPRDHVGIFAAVRAFRASLRS
jgi:uncharacterized membrane protein